MNKKLKETLLALCALDGTAGYEYRVREYIIKEASPFAEGLTTDALGNVIIFRRGKKPPAEPLLLCANMDEGALRVRSIESDGSIKLWDCGQLDFSCLPNTFMHSNRGTLAVVRCPEGSDKAPSLGNCFLDCGETSRAGTGAKVTVGDRFYFHSEPFELANGDVCAKAIQNRLGCAVLLELIKTEQEYDAYYAFTVMGGIVDYSCGGRGAQCVAERVKPTYCLSLDCRGVWDQDGVPEHKRVAAMGGGAVIVLSDHGCGCYRPLRLAIEECASERGVKWQNLRNRGPVTDARGVYPTRGGVRLSIMAAPVRNVNTGHTVLKMQDAEHLADCVKIFIEKAGDFYA